MKDDKSTQKIDIDRIDLEKEKEKAADLPGLIEFAHTVGGALIRPEDKGKIKGRAMAAMREQTDRQLGQLYEQMQTLMHQARDIKKRVEISERIYETQLNFDPIIGKTYYLYEKEDGSDVLSMIAPGEWGDKLPFKQYLASVTLLSDHTWEVNKGQK
ncbi:MAG TPA: DUF2452 domain-containing protein [Cytophagales bacterium]|jgi:hypothetical protein|nr:DUF2452 domain-containing protein [Cytophagales bacterium]